MLRIVSTAIRGITVRANVIHLTNSAVVKQFPAAQCIQQRLFGAFSSSINKSYNVGDIAQKKIFGPSEINSIAPSTLAPTNTSVRTLTKYSRGKGKRKSVKAVPRRFFRLNWGIWIRTIAGRHKALWKRSAKSKQRYKQHIFCNATQSTLLDKMVTSYWKRPRYYVDDPYNSYHKREEFPFTRRKPQPY